LGAGAMRRAICQADEFLALLRAERISIFYIRMPIEFGSIEGAD
jgi:hypothetical protein